MKKSMFFLIIVLFIIQASFTQTESGLSNVLALQEGTLPVAEPAHYGNWSAEKMLDESPESGWASIEGKISNNIFIFEMINSSALQYFEFDTASIDTEGSGAKDIIVEISGKSEESGYETVLKAALAPSANNQRFKADKIKNGRYIRLTIVNNHGSAQYSELFSFRGYGIKPEIASPIENISGTYSTDYSNFHVKQQGTALVGCYEYDEGLLDGIIEGRLMKITWVEKEGRGPAVMVFSPDGKSFRGYWWYSGNEKNQPDGSWDGEKISSDVGGCPHWAGSLGKELKKQLEKDKRARVYGILFDLNSSKIRPESIPVLEDILMILKSETGWKLTIEGHTDSTGTQDHNKTLSLQRAESVMKYLTGKGISQERLKIEGHGSSRPVADNSTEAGRSQNRRVELVRQ